MMKKFFYLLLFTISACSPNNDYAFLEDESSLSASLESVNLESELLINRNTANLILEETFENPTLEFDPYLSDFYPEFALEHSFSLETDIQRADNSVGRFEIRKDDPSIWGGTRAEYSQSWRDTRSEGWYGFSQYFPDSYASDPVAEIVGQWHDREDLGEYAGRSPSNSLQVANDRFRWQLRWDADPVMQNGTSDGHIYIDLGPVPKNKWIDWVVHIKFSHDNTGILEVWKDGEKVIDRQNMPNSYNDENFPYMKWGMYKWEWGNVSEKIMFWDEVRIGTENSSYEEVSTNRINMMVNSNTVDCFGEMEGTCLLVQEGDMIGTETWEKFYYYNGIEGFTYEPGFVYGLLVKKTELDNPQAGGSSIRYELVRIISKEVVGDSEEPLPQDSEPSELAPSEPDTPGNRDWAHNKKILKD